jgi:hypothetical protein
MPVAADSNRGSLWVIGPNACAGKVEDDPGLVIHLANHFGPSVESLRACNFAIGWKILHTWPNPSKYIPNKYNSFMHALFGTILAIASMGFSEKRR